MRRADFLLIFGLLLAAGCADRRDIAKQPADKKAEGGEPSGPRLVVVTTTGMVADLVRKVGGDRVEVTAIMGAGVDPHLYKATRDDVQRILSADAVFYSGLMLEGKMADTLVKVGRSRPVYAVTELLPADTLLEPDGAEGHPDPHVWMDVAAWSGCVDVVANALGEIDPAGDTEYQANAAAHRAELAELDAYVRRVVASIPADRRVLITSHDAFNYFGRAYDIEVQGVQGISTESEAGLQRINELVTLLDEREVPAVFFESSVSPKNVRALIDGAASRGHELQIGGELFSDAMGATGTYEGTYVGMLDHNATLVARALGGEAPACGFGGRLAGCEEATP